MKAKAGLYNMAWGSWDDEVALGVEAERAGHKVQFFTDLMNRYLFKEEGERIFGKEKLAPGPLKGIRNNGVQAIPYGPEQMGATDPLLVMGAVAAATSKIELVMACIDAVRHAPQKLAQSFLTLDHISRGRCSFVLGGSEIKQLTAYGFSRIGSAKKLEEAIQIIRLMFEAEGSPVHFEGEYWKMKGGSLPIRPYGDRPPRVLCAPGVSNEIMGRYSDGMLTFLKRHPGQLEGFRRDVQAMRQAAEKAGRNSSDLLVSGTASLIMHEDTATIDRLAGTRELKFVTMQTARERGALWREHGFEHPLGDEYGYARKLKPEVVDPAVINPAIDKVPAEAVKQLNFFVGSPEEIAEQLRPWIEAGLNYIPLVDYGIWVDHSLADKSAEYHARLIALLQDMDVGTSPALAAA